VPGAAAADQANQVLIYTPSSGQLTLEHPTTVSYAGLAYELHSLIPPAADQGLHYLINEALKRTFVVVEFTVTPTSDQNHRTRLDTAQAWLTEPKWVRQVGRLSQNETRDQIDPYQRPIRGETIKLTEKIYLQHDQQAFNTTDTLYVLAIAPAYNFCAPAAGAYGAQNGLALDTDIAIPQADWVAAGVKMLAWEQFGNLLAQGDVKLAAAKQAEAAAEFATLSEVYLDVPDYTSPPLLAWGPAPSGSAGMSWVS
jgi:hypothetical protein